MTITKGILLAGGTGSRLFPATLAISKQLLPIYDKPMIYYPLSILMLAGIKDILIISQSDQIPIYRKMLGDGDHLGVRFTYQAQDTPKGIADALIIGEEFLAGESFALILGDNFFYGDRLPRRLKKAAEKTDGCTIFCQHVQTPERFGIATFSKDGQVTDIVEKPKDSPSNQAVTGLYFYDREAVDIARSLRPSPRGELEITDVNRVYMERGRLNAEVLGRGVTWFDTGVPVNLLECSAFVATVEAQQGLKIGCIEEICWRNGWLEDHGLLALAGQFGDCPYSQYLKDLINLPD